MIGSAAARHLAEAGAGVTLIGVAENNRHGVFASHYDEARVIRRTDADPVWSDLAVQAIGRYADIQERSGIRFHDPCGHIRCDLPEGSPKSVLQAVRSISGGLGAGVSEVRAGDIRESHPYLHFDASSVLQVEEAPAGIINPRLLVLAQQILAARAGAVLVDQAGHAVRRAGGHFVVETSGESIQARQVLVCTGPHTNDFGLTPEPLPIDVRPETVLLIETPPRVVERLSGMPGIIWNFNHRPPVEYAYVLPPVVYPDRKTYLKIGADNDRDLSVETLEQKRAYMTSPGSQTTASYLRELIDELIPSVRGLPQRTKPCLLTYSPKRYPIVDEVAPDWFVAVAGCGKAAKSSDQIGKLAADAVLRREWTEPFSPDVFRLTAAAG